MQGERLRCKTIQASIEHNREVASLGVARARHERALGQARDREARFWREVASGHFSRPTLAGARVVSGVTRALDAHRKAREAKALLASATREVTRGIARVAQAEVARSAFHKMRSLEAAQRVHTIAELYAEEASELAIARLALRSRGDLVRDRGGIASDVVPNCVSVASQIMVQERPACPGAVFEVAQRTEESLGVRAESPASLSLVGAEVVSDATTPRLMVTLHEASGAEVRCQVSEQGEGEVGIVIASEHLGVVNDLRREKGTLLSRLSALGIPVKEITVEGRVSASSPHGQLHGYKRRRVEEDDESAIA